MAIDEAIDEPYFGTYILWVSCCPYQNGCFELHNNSTVLVTLLLVEVIGEGRSKNIRFFLRIIPTSWTPPLSGTFWTFFHPLPKKGR